MSTGLDVGATLRDFELPDENGTKWRLSQLQGSDAMVLQLGRGEHCPRERAYHREPLELQEIFPIASTSLVTVLPDDPHDTDKMKSSTDEARAAWSRARASR